MEYKARQLEAAMTAALGRGKSALLLGARQTGKSTLAMRFAPQLAVNFVRPDAMLRYGGRPELLTQTIDALGQRGNKARPLVFFDEVQRFPACLDVAQDAIDRGAAQFILTGSSMRQLRHGTKVNLLPGRVVALHLDPFTHPEDPAAPLEQILQDGSLPGIAALPDAKDRETDLAAYVSTYLEEEIRAAPSVRKLGKFARFLELAALESGNVINFSKIAADIGVAHNTVRGYFEILEDSLMLERIEPLIASATRKKLTKSDKYLLFDLGVRRICAREARTVRQEQWGRLLEQWVGLELCRAARLRAPGTRIRFWRDPDGPEVDWVIESPQGWVPVEVKWTDAPKPKDIRHLQTFMAESPKVEQGFVVCRTPHRLRMTERIEAVPWHEMHAVWEHA